MRNIKKVNGEKIKAKALMESFSNGEKEVLNKLWDVSPIQKTLLSDIGFDSKDGWGHDEKYARWSLARAFEFGNLKKKNLLLEHVLETLGFTHEEISFLTSRAVTSKSFILERLQYLLGENFLLSSREFAEKRDSKKISDEEIIKDFFFR